MQQAWVADETLWKLGQDGSPCRVDVPVGYRCESDSLDMDDLACVAKHAPQPSLCLASPVCSRPCSGVAGSPRLLQDIWRRLEDALTCKPGLRSQDSCLQS